MIFTFINPFKDGLRDPRTRSSMIIDIILLGGVTLALLTKTAEIFMLSREILLSPGNLYGWIETLAVLLVVVLTVIIPKFKPIRACLSFVFCLFGTIFSQKPTPGDLGFLLASYAFLFDAPLPDRLQSIFITGMAVFYFCTIVLVDMASIKEFLPFIGGLALCAIVYTRYHHLHPRKQRFDLSLNLSPREGAYVFDLTQGKTYKEIAFAWSVAPSTVRNTVAKALRKLELDDAVELHRMAEKYEFFLSTPVHKSPELP